MSLNANFYSGLRWVAAARLGAQVLSWVSTVWVMRLLSPSDYALVAIVTAALTMATLAAELGFGAAIVQADRLSEQEMRSVFSASLAFAALSAVALAAAAPLLGKWYSAPAAVPMIQVATLTLIIGALATVPDATLRRELTFRRISLVEFAGNLSSTVATLLLALRGYGPWSLVVGPLIGGGLRVILLFACARLWLWPTLNIRPAMHLLRYGLKVAVSRLAAFVFGQADVMIGAAQLSKTQLGEYSIAMHLAMLPMSKLMGVLNTVAFPVIAQLRRDDASIAPALTRGLRVVSYVVLPLLWGLAAMAYWLIPKLLGPGWSGAVVPLQIVCVVLPLRLVSVLLSTALQGLGAAGVELHNTLTGVLVLPGLFYVGARWGGTGLATAWLVGLPLLLALNISRAAPVLGFGISAVARALSLPVLVSGAMALSVIGCGVLLDTVAFEIPGLAAMALAGACSFMSLLWLLDRGSALDLLATVRGRR